MRQYVCMSTFTTDAGHQYCNGDKIYEIEFFTLLSSEKLHFNEVKSDIEELGEPPISKPKRKYDDEGNVRSIHNSSQEDDEDWRSRMRQDDSADIDEIYGGNTDIPDFDD